MSLGLAGGEPVDALELTWDAPPECPTRDDVREAVRGLVVGAQDPQPTRITAKVSPVAPERWRLELVVDNALVAGERVVEAESCSELADATAIVAAISIDPFAAAPRPDDPPVDQPIAPPVDPPVPVPAPTSPAAPLEDAPTYDARWSVGAAGGAGWSSEATGVVRVFAGWERQRLGVRFGADVWLPRRYEDGDPIPRGVRVGHGLAHARVCFVPAWKSVSVPLCGGGRAGLTVARAFGVQSGPARGSLAAAALLSGGLRWTPSFRSSPSLSLFFDAEPAVQLTRPQFHTTTRDPAYVGNPVAITLLAGAEVRFGVRN